MNLLVRLIAVVAIVICSAAFYRALLIDEFGAGFTFLLAIVYVAWEMGRADAKAAHKRNEVKP